MANVWAISKILNCHPEHDKMVAGKKVVLIGSGATAVTILPSIAESAGHVTMVQRTPTYIRCKPEIDPVAEFMNKWLPEWLAVRINRWRAVLLGALFYQYCIRYILHRNTTLYVWGGPVESIRP